VHRLTPYPFRILQYFYALTVNFYFICICVCAQLKIVVGGMIVNYLEDMVKSANGRPVILINPKLQDRPSSNNMMQIRGRQERRDFADSFQTIYAFRLLYPSSGGYMFPISGLIAKNSYHSPWVAYEKEDIPAASSTSTATKENYRIIAAFDPYKIPDPSLVSKVFTGR